MSYPHRFHRLASTLLLLAASFLFSAEAWAVVSFNASGSPDRVTPNQTVTYSVSASSSPSDGLQGTSRVILNHDPSLILQPSTQCSATGAGRVVCDLPFIPAESSYSASASAVFLATEPGTFTQNFAWLVSSQTVANAAVTTNVDKLVATVIATKDTASERDTDPGEFTVTLDTPAPDGGVTVTYNTTGSASPGADYTPLSGSVLVPAGASRATILVNPIDDPNREDDETVVVTLTPGEIYDPGDPDSATVTIVDNDNLTATIEATRSTTEEGGDPGIFTVSLDQPAPQGGVTVGYNVGGSATPGSDYTPLSGAVSIPGGASSAEIQVVALDDPDREQDETVVVDLADGDGYQVGSPASAEVVILPSDNLIATIEATSPTTTEGGDPGIFTVSLDQPAPEGGVTVHYGVGGSATPGSDYSPLSGVVTVPGGASSAEIQVSALDDPDREEAENVVVDLQAGNGYQVGSPASAEVVILANDDVIATVEATNPIAPEGGAPGEFTVSLDIPAPQGGLTVTYQVGGSAEAGVDYTPLSGSVAVAEGATSAVVLVEALDDPDREQDETVEITLVPGDYFVGNPSSATVTIPANDDRTATIEATNPVAPENGSEPGVFTIRLDGPAPQGGITVNYGVSGTAQPGVDYDALSGSVRIPAGETSATVEVQAIDNDEIDDPRTVIASLEAGSGYAPGNPGTATVVIVNDDQIVVTVEASVPDTSEGGEPGRFTVHLSAPAPEQGLVVNYGTEGSATPGEDYQALPGSVAVAAGETSADIEVLPLDDSAIDGPKTVVINLAAGDDYLVGSPDTATVTIADNDEIVATVSASKPIAPENGTESGEFTISLDKPAPGDGVTIQYVTSGSAVPGQDYQDIGSSVTIAAGETEATIEVTAIDNQEVGEAKTVVLTLAADPTYVVGSPDSATVVITDDDQFIATVFASDPDASEDGDPGRFTIQLNLPAPEGGLTINYTTGGNAIPGVDYEDLGTSVDIPAGGTEAIVNVLPLEDNEIDGPKSVILNLAAGDGYSIGSPNAATVTIADDDRSFAAITASKPTTSESGEPGEFTVTLTRPAPTGGLTVSYTVDGTGIPGQDYVALAGRVEVLEGATSATIDVIPIDDNQVDGDKTVIVTLAEGDDYDIGEPAAATVTITDNDSFVATVVASDPDASEEGQNPGRFTISLSAPANEGGITVTYEVGGTAVPGVDYDDIGTSVLIPAGQTSADVLVTPIDDDIVEGTKTVIMSLAAGADYQVGSPSRATVNLADNDNILVSVTATDPDGSEDGPTNGRFTLRLTDPAPTGGLTVNYSVGGSATPGSDYEPIGTSAVVPAGALELDIEVIVLDDNEIEDTETVELTIETGPNYLIGSPDTATVNIQDLSLELEEVSGDGQTAAANTTLKPFVVEAVNNGVARPGVKIQWSIESGGGRLSDEESVTDENGRAETTLSVGNNTDYEVKAVIAETETAVSFKGLVANLASIANLTPNQKSVATALDTLCPNLMNSKGLSAEQQDLRDQCDALLRNQGDSGITGALTALTAEGAAAAGRLITDISNQQFNNITAHLRKTRSVDRRRLLYRSHMMSVDVTIDGQTIPAAALEGMLDALLPGQPSGGAAGADGEPDEPVFGKWSVFVTGSADFGKRDPTDNESGFSFNTTGLTLGADYRFSEQMIFGGALGYAHTDTNMKGSSGELKVDGWNGSLFGTYYFTGPYYAPDQFYIDGIVTAGRNSYDSERDISYGVGGEFVSRSAKADYDGDLYGISLGGGYDYNRDQLSLGLYGRFNYVSGNLDSYEEDGAGGLGLRLDSQDVKSFKSILGGQISWAFTVPGAEALPSMVLVPQFSGEWLHEFEGLDNDYNAQFVGDPLGTSFGISTDDPDRDYFRLGAGLSATFRGGVSAFLDYRTTLGLDETTDHNVNGGIRWEF